ncbi:tripartite tricarboxylate transporter TctB family protein [Alloyangia pacifica]|uniref:Tripartite tricarboxylate transporter TctB family protein n=1 Tax=Alloyangia pacifica TaxID=311180 RepID=A0A1I6WD34_9RHOB|nr:tripartite tricarboxylate transporter TctB family protein [Alloyangia pacifica]SDI59767.1 Tripartite tricarboxylate transporter TctB family protein [Alloyangia pacifica]SFT23910.1 Tripartite tricarboxylate transporter TctB family protein [Alloyangia pacifica]
MRDTQQGGRLRRALQALTSVSGLGGLTLLLSAAAVLAQVQTLSIGSAAAMGPGYFPAALAGLLIFFGVVLLVESWRHPDQRVSLGPLLPVSLVLGSIVAFALTLKFLGGAIAVLLVVLLSALAEPRRKLKELVLLGVIVLALVWLIFVVGLDLQIAMLPKGLLS